MIDWKYSPSLIELDRISHQKIIKDISELNNTINQLHIIDIYIILHSILALYTYLSNSYAPFSKRSHIPSYGKITP